MVAVMPPAPGLDHPTDLLLCGHHYRASRSALAAAGAVVFELGGLSERTPDTQRTAALAATGEQ